MLYDSSFFDLPSSAIFHEDDQTYYKVRLGWAKSLVANGNAPWNTFTLHARFSRPMENTHDGGWVHRLRNIGFVVI